MKKVGSESISGIDFFDYIDFFDFADLQVFVAQNTKGQALIPIERYTVQYNFHLEKGSPLHLEKGLWEKRLGKSHLEKGLLKKIPFQKQCLAEAVPGTAPSHTLRQACFTKC